MVHGRGVEVDTGNKATCVRMKVQYEGVWGVGMAMHGRPGPLRWQVEAPSWEDVGTRSFAGGRMAGHSGGPTSHYLPRGRPDRAPQRLERAWSRVTRTGAAQNLQTSDKVGGCRPTALLHRPTALL